MSLNQFNTYKKTFNEKLNHIINDYVENEDMKERIHYCLNNGKRLRPIIALDICLKLGGKIEDVIKVCLAIELIHNSSLIIDDLPCMDNDDFRRGDLSFHKKYNISQSQIVAQYIINLSFKLINDNFKNNNDHLPKFLKNICKNLGILGVAGGQLIDVTPINIMSNKKDIKSNINTKKNIEELCYKKTCSLFEIAFLSGYLSGNGDVEKIPKLLEAANNFGLAFQIYDDFDDIEQDKLRVKLNLNDPNYINNFGKKDAYNKFNECIENFKKNLQEIELFSTTMEQLYEFLESKVKKKINYI